MNFLSMQGGSVTITLSLEELLIIGSSLNEVCNGMDAFEFETRMGAKLNEVSGLLKEINEALDGIGRE